MGDSEPASPRVYVLDSFAVLAYLEDEPAAARVQELLTQANDGQALVLLCVVNYGEVLYITERERGLPEARRVITLLEQLPIALTTADLALTLVAAHAKAQHTVSYADAYAVALAQTHQATLLTGDPEFHAVEHMVNVEWLPQR